MSSELIERSNTILESRKLTSPTEEATAEIQPAPLRAALRTATIEKCSLEGAKRDIFQVSFAETLAQFGRLHEKAKFQNQSFLRIGP